MSIIATISIDTPQAANDENRVTVNCERPSAICGRDGESISEAMKFTAAYTYARMLNELPRNGGYYANFCYDGGDILPAWQEDIIPTIYLCTEDREVELYCDGISWETQNFTFKRGKFYLFRPASVRVWDESTGVEEYGIFAPTEIESVEEMEEYFGFLSAEDE